MIKKHISVILLVLFFVSVAEEAFSQRTTSRRSSRDRDRQEEKVSFADKLNYNIGLGNVGLGSNFSISLKGTVAYKPIDQLAFGGGGRFLYIFTNRIGGPDISLFDWGGVAFGRFLITENIYIQGEYNFASFDRGDNFDRLNHSYPQFGGGYMSGYGPWKYGIQLLFVADELARDYTGTTIDYWIMFSYNF